LQKKDLDQAWRAGEKKANQCQLILGMIDVEGDQGHGQDQETEDTDADLDHDQDPETDTQEDHHTADHIVIIIVPELVHRLEEGEVENAPEVEAVIDIIDEEDNY